MEKSNAPLDTFRKKAGAARRATPTPSPNYIYAVLEPPNKRNMTLGNPNLDAGILSSSRKRIKSGERVDATKTRAQELHKVKNPFRVNFKFRLNISGSNLTLRVVSNHRRLVQHVLSNAKKRLQEPRGSARKLSIIGQSKCLKSIIPLHPQGF